MELAPKPGILPVTFVSRREGLTGSQIHDIAIDGSGSVWIAGSTGLSRYDGTRVVNFGVCDGLRTHGLRSIAFTPNGQLWIAGDAGIDVVEQDGSVHASPRHSSPSTDLGVVDKVRARTDGSLFAATPAGLVHSAGDDVWSPVRQPILASSLIQDFTICTDGSVWAVGTGIGLMRLQNEAWVSVPGSEFADIGEVHVVADASSPGRVLLGGAFGIAEIDQLGRVHRTLVTAEPGGVHVLTQRGETVWAAIGSRLVELSELASGWDPIASYLEDISINAIVADDFDNAWVATDEAGLAKVSSLRTAVRQVTADTPGAVLSIRKTARGDVLIGASQGALTMPVDRAVSPMLELEGAAVWDLVEDKGGARWAATSDGIWHSVGSAEFDRIGHGNRVFDSPGRALLERSTTMWVGSLAGLAYWDAEAITVTGAAGEPLGYVYTLVEDPSGRLWVGTLGNGLWIEQPHGLVKLVGPGLIDTGNTYGIAFLEDGAAVVTQDDRLLRIASDLGSSVIARSESPVFGWGVAVDADDLWVGTPAGLAQRDLHTGKLQREIAVFLGAEGWEFTTSRSLLLDDDGSLLCGTMHGLLAVSPRQLPDLTQRPTVSLDRISWNEADPERFDDTLVVTTGKWTCSIFVFSPWRIDESDLTFRFQLVGFDTGWSEPTATGAVRYNSLPPGSYELEAQAYSPLVGWGPPTALAKIRVLPSGASWNRLSSINGALMWVGRRVRLGAAEIEDRVRERTSELETSLAEMQRANAALRSAALTDSVTGMLNRRHFDAAMRSEWNRASERGRGIGLLMIDIDFFKWFNDDFGHQAGDRVLREVGLIISSVARRATDAARWGGEEFALIVLHGDLEQTALEICDSIRAAAIWHPRGVGGIVTVSIGGAQLAPDQVAHDAFGWSELVGRADSALYEAKRAGRDRTIIQH